MRASEIVNKLKDVLLSSTEVEKVEDVLLNRRSDATDRLLQIANEYRNSSNQKKRF